MALRQLPVIAILGMVACAPKVYPVAINTMTFDRKAMDRIDSEIVLCLPQELVSQEWKRGFIIQLGEWLATNAEAMARAAFREVLVNRETPC